jgi:hypothetical protein
MWLVVCHFFAVLHSSPAALIPDATAFGHMTTVQCMRIARQSQNVPPVRRLSMSTVRIYVSTTILPWDYMLRWPRLTDLPVDRNEKPVKAGRLDMPQRERRRLMRCCKEPHFSLQQSF